MYNALLQQKIIKFLQQQDSIEDSNKRKEAVKFFTESKGECVGLSTLWAYAKRISEDTPTDNTPRDDIKSFNKVQDLLISWDESSSFNKAQEADIERFISNILLYQKPAFLIFNDGNLQLDLLNTLQDTKKGSPIKDFDSKDFVCTKDSFLSRLKQVIQPKTMIFLSSRKDGQGHTMSAYKNSTDGQIFFYDSNKGKEVLAQDAKELLEQFWEASDPSNFMSGFGGFDPLDFIFRNVSIEIFRFEEDLQHNYGTPEEFKLSTKEIASTFKEHGMLSRFKTPPKVIQDMLKSCNDQQLLELLKDESLSENIKNLIIKCAIAKIEENQEPNILARYLVKHHKDSVDPGKLTNLKIKLMDTISDDILNYPDLIGPIEAVLLLSKPESLGNTKLVEDVFTKCQKDVHILQDHTFRLLVGAPVVSNLAAGHIETAQVFVREIANKLNILFSLEQIEGFGNPELAQFVLQELGSTAYGDSFGNPPLRLVFMADKIIESKKIEPLEAVQILSQEENLGNTQLVIDTLTLCKAKTPELLQNRIFSLFVGDPARKNLAAGHIETAQVFVRELANKLNILFSLDQIEEFGSPELAQFVLQELGSTAYGDSFGNPPLKLVFMAQEILNSRENANPTIDEEFNIEECLEGVRELPPHGNSQDLSIDTL